MYDLGIMKKWLASFPYQTFCFAQFNFDLDS